MEIGREDMRRGGGVLRRTFWVLGENLGAFVLFSVLLGGTPLILQAMACIAIYDGVFQWFGWRPLLSALLNGQFRAAEELLQGFVPFLPQFTLRTLGIAALLSLSGLLIGVLLTPFVTGGVTNVTAGALHGVKKTAGQWFSATRPFYGRLIGTGLCFVLVDFAFSVILSTLLSVVAAAVAIGGVSLALAMQNATLSVLLAPLSFVLLSMAASLVYYAVRGLLYPAAVGEGLYYFGAVSRAVKFALRNFGRCFGVLLLTGLLVTLWRIAAVAAGILSVTLGGAPAFLGAGIAAALTALAQPLPMIAFTVLYYDLRAKQEGSGAVQM